jgi:hypothetical protein
MQRERPFETNAAGRQPAANVAAFMFRTFGQVVDTNLAAMRVLLQTQARAASAFGWPDVSDVFERVDGETRGIFATGARQLVQTAQQTNEAAADLQREFSRVVEAQTATVAQTLQQGFEQLGSQASEGLRQLCQTAREQAHEAERAAQSLGEQMQGTMRQGGQQFRDTLRQGGEQLRQAARGNGEFMREGGPPQHFGPPMGPGEPRGFGQFGPGSEPMPPMGQGGEPMPFAGQGGEPMPFGGRNGEPSSFGGQSGEPSPFAGQGAYSGRPGPGPMRDFAGPGGPGGAPMRNDGGSSGYGQGGLQGQQPPQGSFGPPEGQPPEPREHGGALEGRLRRVGT